MPLSGKARVGGETDDRTATTLATASRTMWSTVLAVRDPSNSYSM